SPSVPLLDVSSVEQAEAVTVAKAYENLGRVIPVWVQRHRYVLSAWYFSCFVSHPYVATREFLLLDDTQHIMPRCVVPPCSSTSAMPGDVIDLSERCVAQGRAAEIVTKQYHFAQGPAEAASSRFQADALIGLGLVKSRRSKTAACLISQPVTGRSNRYP